MSTFCWCWSRSQRIINVSTIHPLETMNIMAIHVIVVEFLSGATDRLTLSTIKKETNASCCITDVFMIYILWTMNVGIDFQGNLSNTC